MGIFLSANSHGENMPAPVSIDFGAHGEMHSDRFNCTDETYCAGCNVEYDCDIYGAFCCDHAIYLEPSLTCEILETGYYWNCSGCECSAWDNGYNGYGNNGEWNFIDDVNNPG